MQNKTTRSITMHHQNHQQKSSAGSVKLAQLIKCLLLKHEDLSLIPTTHIETQMWLVVQACNLSAGEADTGRSLQLSKHPWPNRRAPCPSEWSCLKKQSKQIAPNTQGWPLVSANLHLHRHVCICAHTHACARVLILNANKDKKDQHQGKMLVGMRPFGDSTM